ncbi:MAG: Rne/Rng family ribonuclease [Bacteriovoracaceae bacterium]|nr:Rne/Rng family ribonuclease [Bacteriovoracaceae bacterium]
MSKELLINLTHNESRLALISNGEIQDFLVNRSSYNDETFPTVGDVYLGKVLRVLPGMQSAFVDIGHEKAAFLYVNDAYIPTLEEQREMTKKLTEKNAEEESKLGETIPDEMSTFTETVDLRFRPDVRIEDFVREGDELVVQVAKEPISTKGPRITRHITLAGRFIVYMPFIEHTGVSRRIENEQERTRLKEVLDSIRPEGVGVIARTVAEGQSYKVLKQDYNDLVKAWKDIQRGIEKGKAPNLVHKDLSFVQRSLRDILDEKVEKVIVDDKGVLKQVEKFIMKYQPELKGKIKMWDSDIPLFEQYGVEKEIQKALARNVELKSGGHLTIDQTEALVSIDVNTGKFVGKKTLEDTILKTNLDAVSEICHQLKMRNCGGIIILDFIDMEKEEHRSRVYNALLEGLKHDRAKTNVLPISGLGLVEMTRKRTRDTLIRMMCEPCPYCVGTGKVKSAESVCYDLLRELNKIVRKAQSNKISVFSHPEVSAKLTNDMGIIETIEELYDKQIVIRADNNYHIEQYEIYSHDF